MFGVQGMNLHQRLADALNAVQDAPPDVRSTVKRVVNRVLAGGMPSQEERDIVFAWVNRQQQQNKFGKGQP